MNAELRTNTTPRIGIQARLHFAAVILLLVSGCRSVHSVNTHYRGRTARPVVAVTSFENLANASGRWNLGDGMADLLVTELIDSERVVVLERQNL